MKLYSVFSLESPHRGDSNEYTQYTIFNIKKKITLNYPKYFLLGPQARIRNSRGKPAISVRATTSRPVAKAYSVILKTVSIRRRDYFFVILVWENIGTTSGILRAIVLLTAGKMDKFKDFEIKSRLFFNEPGGF